MESARAAIAGILATGIVLLMVFPSETLREPERAFAALALLLGIVALMVGIDVVGIVRPRQRRDDDDDKKED
jgi:hypothetical protein